MLRGVGGAASSRLLLHAVFVQVSLCVGLIVLNVAIFSASVAAHSLVGSPAPLASQLVAGFWVSAIFMSVMGFLQVCTRTDIACVSSHLATTSAHVWSAALPSLPPSLPPSLCFYVLLRS